MKRINLAILAICALLIFGCSQQAPEPQTSPPSQSGDVNVGSGAQGGNDVIRQATETQNQSSPDFIGLMEAGRAGSWKIGYDVSSKTEQRYANSSSSYQSIEYMKNGKRRIDAIGNIRFYFLDGQDYVCLRPSGNWACQKNPTPEQSIVIRSKIETNPSSYSATYDGTMRILGTESSCYKLEDIENFNLKYCLSSTGAPLFVSAISNTGGAYEIEMVATSYETTVSDSDLELPAPIAS